jgi:2-polyprenyl-6-methoxyphenol hydroxylase-like FAD-dependent oxidoreductase
MTRRPRVAIIGGGIGGLAAALALDRRGAEVVVYEQSSGPSDIGGGLHLSPNALKALRVLGVEDSVIASGSLIWSVHCAVRSQAPRSALDHDAKRLSHVVEVRWRALLTAARSRLTS